ALTGNHFDSIRRVCQNVRQRRTLRRSEVSQHVVCRGLTTGGPTDADAHADEVTRADRRDDVAQAIVPAVPTTLLELDAVERDVQFVVHHDQPAGVDLVEPHEGGDRPAGQVHEAVRL